MADSMTVNRLLRFLAARGHDVHLACFVEHAAEADALERELGQHLASINTVIRKPWQARLGTFLRLPGAKPMQVDYYHSRAMKSTVERLVNEHEFDVCYTHLIRMAEYTRFLALPKVIGMQISQSLNLGRMYEVVKDPLRKLFYFIESRRVAPYEATVAEKYDYAMLCGQSDIDEIRRRTPLANAVVCPHGQNVPDEARLNPDARDPHSIVITGVMSTYTNVDAASWFAEDVFPRIRQRFPDATFHIVGRNPQASLQKLDDGKAIFVTGEVDDVYEWLCGKAVAVAPLRVAAGMQNKIIQAMASHTPVVATSIANEGVGGSHEENILIADDAEALANAVMRLFDDNTLYRRIGAEGRRFVQKYWTWDALFERLERHLELAAVARHPDSDENAGKAQSCEPVRQPESLDSQR